MDVGTELRAARMAAGLSLEQISKHTKIQVAKLEALEANQFHRLPQGVYLEGIVRAYAKEVGIDGQPLVAHMYAEPDLPAVRHIDATGKYDLDTFASEAELAAQPVLGGALATASEPAIRPPGGARLHASHAALAVLALAASFGLGWYLYHAARPFPDPRRSSVPAVSRDAVRTGAADGVDVAGGPDSTATTDNAATEPTSIEAGGARASANDASAATVEDFSGTWRLTTEIQSTNVRTFEGLQLGYHVQLDQHGQQISGSGEKISENGRALPAAARTAIVVRGTVEGNQLALTFIEQGTRRSTHGAFVLQRRDDGTLRGRFSSNAAQSSGLVEARRPEG